MKSLPSLCFLCLCISLFPSFSSPAILFQGFNWASREKAGGWYNFLKTKVPDIADAGVEYVWLPPPSNSHDDDGPQVYKKVYKHHFQWLVYLTSLELNENLGECHMSRTSWWGAPDIDHTNPKVQKELSDWMNWLKTEVGFVGWRFDMVVGYAPRFTKIYMEQTSPDFAVGELYRNVSRGQDGRPLANQDAHRATLVSWVDAVQGELWRLKDANGKPPGMIGTKPANAVTFVDNHDTWSQRTWPLPSDKVMLGYVYILTHPGHPTIFYDHDIEWGLKEPIKTVTEIRKRNGINPTSTVNILAAEADLYMAEVDNKIIVKIGPKQDLGNLLPPNVQVATSGQDYAVWERK